MTARGSRSRGGCRDRAAAAVDVRELEGEPTALIDAWDGAGAAVLVDAAALRRAAGHDPPLRGERVPFRPRCAARLDPRDRRRRGDRARARARAAARPARRLRHRGRAFEVGWLSARSRRSSTALPTPCYTRRTLSPGQLRSSASRAGRRRRCPERLGRPAHRWPETAVSHLRVEARTVLNWVHTSVGCPERGLKASVSPLI